MPLAVRAVCTRAAVRSRSLRVLTRVARRRGLAAPRAHGVNASDLVGGERYPLRVSLSICCRFYGGTACWSRKDTGWIA